MRKLIVSVVMLGISTLAYSGSDHDHGSAHSHNGKEHMHADKNSKSHGHDGGHAHGAHGHAHLDEKSAQEVATQVIDGLIVRKKLKQSWSKATFVKAYQKKFKNKEEWVLEYKNATEADAKKKILYIFLSDHGDYLGANFTGK